MRAPQYSDISDALFKSIRVAIYGAKMLNLNVYVAAGVFTKNDVEKLERLVRKVH
jgi:hypothetical protein